MILTKPTSLLGSVFFFSGFTSLIYQVVWQRILTSHYGVGAISIALIVSVYMVGLGLGALLGGLLAERVKNKIILYFIVELLIGLFGLTSLPFLHYLGRHTAGSNYSVAFFYMFMFLSLPTVLMGITLPLLTKIFNSWIQNFFDTVSLLYFINTIGAAAGALFASYLLISFFGLDITVYFAVAINFALALLILLARSPSFSKDREDHRSEPQDNQETLKGAYLLVFITGFLAIGYEIVWFRVIGVILKDSPYVFSSVLSVYLLGVACGSFGMNKFLKTHPSADKRNLFFQLQVLIGLYVMAIFVGYYYLTKYTMLDIFTRASFSIIVHPSPSITPDFSSLQAFLLQVYSFVDVFFWPTVFIFVPTLFMGASFPLISFLALSKPDEEGKTVGTVYFFNILGNVLGGIVTGFLLLARLGTELTLIAFAAINIFMLLFVSQLAGRYLGLTQRTGLAVLLVIALVICFPQKGQLYETIHTPRGREFKTYFEEGIDGVTMAYASPEKVLVYINGTNHGPHPDDKYFFETAEALSFAPKVENILIIGFGAGSITETVLRMNEVRNVTLVELSDALMQNVKKISTYHQMLADKRLRLVIEDGRRFLLRMPDKYDLILMDPLRTTTAYANNLHSREFFELASQRLNRGGILLLGGMSESRVLPKTIASVFDYMRMYSYFCIASNVPFNRNDQRQRDLLAKFSQEMQAAIAKNHDLYLGDQTYVKARAANYPINQESKPVTEYYLGLAVKKAFFGL